LSFTDFWNTSLHDGVFDTTLSAENKAEFTSSVSSISIKNSGNSSERMELTLYIKEGIGDGAGADNPILQELPDPVSKIVWDNYITMNPSEMKEKGYNTHFGQREEMQVLEIIANGKSITLPVIAQPGQAKGTLGVALGYGKNVGKMKTPTGINAYPLLDTSKETVSYITNATIKEVETDEPRFIACTQGHSTIMGRDAIIRETTLDVYKKGNKEDFNPAHTLLAHENGESVNKITKEFNLWGKDQPVENIGHRWGMSIDMNLCTGCGACITACNIENNVAVIGQDEMRRGRSMHWLRIDRYYSSEYQDPGDIAGTLAKTKEATGKGTTFSYQEMETPADNPMVVHQPMMCQHCNHAGCETVCPVAATTHSNEGLNMMTYNRCIGTRYCANNCAYKVRRFNWYNYTAYKKFTDFNPSQDDLGRMVLNPDVVVRTRGVMEKCSMCIQGIQAAKLEAKKEGRPVRDGDVDCACAGACGSSAITFGDLNDTKSQVRAGMEHDRAYRVIEEKGQEPNIYYQAKVRNVNSKEA
jgi:molybdopterin-containing oxidoreductase family iron-sulfur binding subunit